jgi:hypothetical protein
MKKLSAPQRATWIVAVVVGVAGILVHERAFRLGTLDSFWMVAAAFVLLAVATLVRGL